MVVLRYMEDRSEVETASLMGCSVGTVKGQCSRALASSRFDAALRSDVEEGEPVMCCQDLKFLARRAESVRVGPTSASRRCTPGSARPAAVVPSKRSSGAAALVVAVAVGIALLTGSTVSHQDNAPPISRGTTVNTPSTQPEPTTRKLVYVDGFWPMRKIHVGNQTVDVSDQSLAADQRGRRAGDGVSPRVR